MLSNLSIRRKIIAVVSILLAAMTIVGLSALKEIGAVNSRLGEVQGVWLRGVLALGDIQATVLRHQTAIRDHLLANDPETEAQAEQAIHSLEEGIEQKFSAYEGLKSTTSDRTVYSEFRNVWSGYLAAASEVLTASKNQDFATGREVFSTKLFPLSQRTDELLHREREMNRMGAAAAVERGDASYALAVKIIFGGLILATLISAIIAYYMVRDISYGIHSIIEPMYALRDGNLAANIRHASDRTEIGQMANALRSFQSALMAKKRADDSATAEASAKLLRTQRIDGITSEFESIIGEMVTSLAHSSNELQLAADSLTTTAETTGKQSSEAASASEDVSDNVQSVAGATGKMTESIQSIGSRPRNHAVSHWRPSSRQRTPTRTSPSSRGPPLISAT